MRKLYTIDFRLSDELVYIQHCNRLWRLPFDKTKHKDALDCLLQYLADKDVDIIGLLEQDAWSVEQLVVGTPVKFN
jgi:hypothetical protein